MLFLLFSFIFKGIKKWLLAHEKFPHLLAININTTWTLEGELSWYTLIRLQMGPHNICQGLSKNSERFEMLKNT